MKLIERIFGIVNGIYFLGFILFLLNAATLATALVSPVTILILLIPIVIGVTFSFRYLFNKYRKLYFLDKILILLPLLNMLIIGLLIVLMSM